MAGEDDLGTVLDKVLDGGDGGADTGVVGDVLVVVERDVEVGAHEHALPLEVGGGEVPDALLRHGGDGARPARGRRRRLPAPRRDVGRQPRVRGRRERQRPRRLAPGRQPPRRSGDAARAPPPRAPGGEGERGRGRAAADAIGGGRGSARGGWNAEKVGGGRGTRGWGVRKERGFCGREGGGGDLLIAGERLGTWELGWEVGVDDTGGCVGEEAAVIAATATCGACCLP